MRRWATALIVALALCARAEKEDRQALADGLYVRGLHDLAAREYLDLLRDPPDRLPEDEVLYRLGECYRQLDQAALAERFYKRVMREHPDSPFKPRAELRRAQLFAANGQDADAAGLLRRLIETEPPPDVAAAAWYERARCDARRNRADESAKAYRALLQRYPESPWAPPAAIELGDALAGQADSAEERKTLYAHALERAGSEQMAGEALMRLGDLAYEAGHYAEASERFAQLMRDYPDHPRSMEAALQAAWSAHHAGRFKDALDLVDRMPDEKRATEADAWLYIEANSARRMGVPDRALAAYARLIEHKPDSRLSPAARYERAWTLFNEGRLAELTLLTEDDAPTSSEADYAWMMAEALRSEGRSPEARRWYARVVDADPGHIRADRALMLGAQLAEEGGAADDALAAYRRIAERYPQSEYLDQALLQAGALCADRDRFEEAVDWWNKLIARVPAGPSAEEAAYRIGLAEMKRARPEAAIEAFASVTIRTGSMHRGQALFWTGVLREGQTNLEAAATAYREALPLLDEPEASGARYRLAAALHRAGETNEAGGLLLDLAAEGRVSLSPELLEWLARHHLARGDGPAAVVAARALVAASSHAVAWAQIGSLLEGEGWALQGQSREAQAAYARAAATPPASPEGAEAGLRRALDLLETEPMEAARLYERAAEWAGAHDRPDLRARAYFGLGDSAERRGESDQAIRHYLAVAVLFDDPDRSPEALYRAYRLLKALERTEEAASTSDELLARYPESEQARRLATEDKGR